MRPIALVAAIASLPPEQRAAVVLRYFEDLNDAEIVRVFAESEGDAVRGGQ